MDILQRMPWAAQDAVFKRLSEIAEVASLSKQEREQYDESLRKYRDTLAVMTGQFMEGEAKGRAEEKMEMAQKMKSHGIEPSLISQITGLSTEEVERL